MINAFVERIAHLAINLIDDEDIKTGTREYYYEEIRYRVTNQVMNLINFALVLVISILLNSIYSSIGFMLGLYLFRGFFGGSHAKTPEKCLVATTLIIVVAGQMLKLIEHNMISYMGLTMFAFVLGVNTNVKLHPEYLDDKPEERDQAERKRKREGIIFLVSCLTLCWLGFEYLNSILFSSITSGIVFGAIDSIMSK